MSDLQDVMRRYLAIQSRVTGTVQAVTEAGAEVAAAGGRRLAPSALPVRLQPGDTVVLAEGVIVARLAAPGALPVFHV